MSPINVIRRGPFRYVGWFVIGSVHFSLLRPTYGWALRAAGRAYAREVAL